MDKSGAIPNFSEWLFLFYEKQRGSFWEWGMYVFITEGKGKVSKRWIKM